MSSIQDRLELALNGELARRLLIKYFADKGFVENFDHTVYPPLLQDLAESVPQLASKIELVPHAIEIDPQTGSARIGWNLFVLGNQRMYLGETDHTDLGRLAQQIDEGHFRVEAGEPLTARQTRSAREIVTWMSRTLGRSMAGIVRDVDETSPRPTSLLAGANTQSMWERPKTIRPEGTAQF